MLERYYEKQLCRKITNRGTREMSNCFSCGYEYYGEPSDHICPNCNDYTIEIEKELEK